MDAVIEIHHLNWQMDSQIGLVVSVKQISEEKPIHIDMFNLFKRD